jgi:hypothetical protein
MGNILQDVKVFSIERTILDSSMKTVGNISDTNRDCSSEIKHHVKENQRKLDEARHKARKYCKKYCITPYKRTVWQSPRRELNLL